MIANRDALLARVAAFGFIVLWSTGYLAAKLVLPHAGSFTVLVWRFGAAALIFGMMGLVARAPWPDRRRLAHSAVIGLLTLALQFGGVYAGIKLGASASIAALVIGAMPLTVCLMSLMLGVRISPLQWFGLALGLSGVLLTIGQSLATAHAGMIAGIALLLGLIGISAGTLYQKQFVSNIDLRISLFVQNLVATLVLLPLAIGLEGLHQDGSVAFWGSLSWLVLVNSIGTYSLLFVLLRRGEATQVAALFYLIPPVTVVMAHFVLHEELTGLELAGFAVAAAGVYLSTRQSAAIAAKV
jgi:drug/metabolite transporter (DMT)-like permease